VDPRLCAWRRHDTLDRKCRRNLAGGLSLRCERAGELRSDTSRTGAHRLLPWPKSVLSWTIGSCRCQSSRAIRRRVVSGNYRNRPSETQTTSATIKAQTIPARPARLGHSRGQIKRGLRTVLHQQGGRHGHGAVHRGHHYRGAPWADIGKKIGITAARLSGSGFLLQTNSRI
jgi:hypothetical protein